eukprot:8328484-Pyramimonas_sp.AAC.1
MHSGGPKSPEGAASASALTGPRTARASRPQGLGPRFWYAIHLARAYLHLPEQHLAGPDLDGMGGSQGTHRACAWGSRRRVHAGGST